MNLLRPQMIARWLLAVALAGGYVCSGGCWHHDHDDHDDHRDWHDHDHGDYHDHDHDHDH